MRKNKDKERGAVLLTTLLLLTVMATVTVIIMDDILFAVRRATNIEAAEQLDWYGRGGEEFAEAWLKAIHGKDQIALTQAIISRTPLTLPIDENNELRLFITDGRNCFNVNQFSNDAFAEAALKRLSNLLQNMDFGEFSAQTLSVRIADWIDADSVPRTGGAENYTYLNQYPSYHAADRPMVDITELRAIEGINNTVFERLAPLLCAAGDSNDNKLNLNTLQLEQAPLLASILGVDGGLGLAVNIISTRPVSGYDNIDDIWQRRDVQSLKLNGSVKEKVKLTTDRIVVTFQVSYQGQIRNKSVLYALDGNGNVELITRRGRF